jgi:hypothetical protein
MANGMNKLAPTPSLSPTPFTEAPLGFGPGGPLPAPTPWINYGPYIQYTNGGVVLGNPAGGNKGPGTLNAVNVYFNGVSLDIADYLPLSGGVVNGPLTVQTGPISFTVGLSMNGPLTGAIIDEGTF